MNFIKKFNEIRDIPYKIPLSIHEKSQNCCGKHIELKKYFEKHWLEVRYRVCSFLWSSIHLPEKVKNIPHDDYSMHVYLEVYIENKWVAVDATWDSEIEDILLVNTWDGKIDTKIAVEPIEIFSLEKSKEIMQNPDNQEILDDLEKHGEFYKVFNNWLEEVRKEWK